jgi:hypothetical protein
MTKRKVNYPRARSNNKRAPAAEQSVDRPNLATIDLTAGVGQAGFAVGDRVRIGGSGLYAGETAVIERLSGGVIPSALVRTESSNTRQVRTIDLERVAPTKSA